MAMGQDMLKQAAFAAMDYALPGSGTIARFGTQMIGGKGGGGQAPPTTPRPRQMAMPIGQQSLQVGSGFQPMQAPQASTQAGTFPMPQGPAGAGADDWQRRIMQALMMSRR